MLIFNSFAFFGLPGGSEWFLVFLVILLLFGGAKIPQLMRGVGRGMGELQKGLEEGKRALNTSVAEAEEEAAKKSAQP
ncbi:MAG: twin-arginine translocase TatA/TatE family subunit [Chthonomonas sp.]|nr:twin-arginine translocase TatA/TatE family subunit [Chthonomonas sp.]